MLAAAQRLRRRDEFTAAVRNGRRAGRGVLVVHLSTVADNADNSVEPARTTGDSLPVRAGFVVPKAVGGAVVRNKVRRRLRHLIRERLTGLPAGSALVVRALPAAGGASYSELANNLDEALAATRRPKGVRTR